MGRGGLASLLCFYLGSWVLRRFVGFGLCYGEVVASWVEGLKGWWLLLGGREEWYLCFFFWLGMQWVFQDVDLLLVSSSVFL